MQQNDLRARPTYSRIRTSLLKLTPGDQKCRLYCRGTTCKYCVSDGVDDTKQALKGLYSTWVTDEILAMARLFVTHFEKFDIIKQFHETGIRSVINLEEQGEHAFCGSGLSSSGFSYNPEDLMRQNIYYYNFPLPDFGSCSVEHLLDIAKVAKHALSIGKLAIHCHAGHGRTGMVIAAIVMYQQGLSAYEAVRIVRSKRAQSVQSIAQVDTLNSFEQLILDTENKSSGQRQFTTITDFVNFNSRFLSKTESRFYGLIPKIIYTTCIELLEEFYESVNLELITTEALQANSFLFRCGPAKQVLIPEEHLLLLDVECLCRFTCRKSPRPPAQNISENDEMPGYIMMIAQIHNCLMNSFHQLCTTQELSSALQSEKLLVRDWYWPLFLLTTTCSHLPSSLQESFAKLCSQWFCRKPDAADVILHTIANMESIR